MASKHKKAIVAQLESAASRALLLAQDAEFLTVFEQVVDAMLASFRAGGRLYIAGNGGSAADSQHLAAELVGKLGRVRGPIPAEALTVDTSALTAIANDFGYEFVFSRQLEGKATRGDLFLAISTSGRSANILRALEIAKRLDVRTVLLTGPKAGEASRLAEFVLSAPGETASEIQQGHLVIYHSLCGCLEDELFPREPMTHDRTHVGLIQGNA